MYLPNIEPRKLFLKSRLCIHKVNFWSLETAMDMQLLKTVFQNDPTSSPVRCRCMESFKF